MPTILCTRSAKGVGPYLEFIRTPQGVRVNAISPGVVLTPAPGEVHPGEIMMKGTPAGRMGTPDAIANAAVHLAGDESSFVHGIVLDVDGGRTAAAVIAG
jgi:NAD(P)-dependent dehydrogenase (short-subunit alcohol dehydrogenase family)